MLEAWAGSVGGVGRVRYASPTDLGNIGQGGFCKASTGSDSACDVTYRTNPVHLMHSRARTACVELTVSVQMGRVVELLRAAARRRNVPGP